MWYNGKPLKMLKSLNYNLVATQYIIDVDKYIASNNEGYDLCQMYMPQCTFCNMSAENSCSAAFFVGNHYDAVCGIIDGCEADELAVIQSIIDVDKYLVSETVDYDVCGMYAPFCAVCNKYAKYPCATAYIRYKRMEGTNNLSEVTRVYSDVKTDNATTVAAAVYEPEISVPAGSYLRGTAVVDDAVRRSMHPGCIKIATIRRRSVLGNKGDSHMN